MPYPDDNRGFFFSYEADNASGMQDYLRPSEKSENASLERNVKEAAAPKRLGNLYAEAIAYQNDMREFGRELGQPGYVTPDVLAQRFYKNAVSVARQRPTAVQISYLQGLVALVHAEISTRRADDSLNCEFLVSLHALLNDATDIIESHGVGIELNTEDGVESA